MKNRNEVSAYLENISILLLGAYLVVFPLLFTDLTTDLFSIPKQLLTGGVALVLLLLSGAHMLSEGNVRVTRTPFDVPIIIFALVAVASSVISTSKADAILAVAPVVFAVVLYFFFTNLIKSRAALVFLVSSFVLGVTISAGLSALSFFKVYPIPLAYTKVPYFTTVGGLLELAVLIAFSLPMVIAFAYKGLAVLVGGAAAPRDEDKNSLLGIALVGTVATLILAAGLGTTVYQLATTQKPLILPFSTGFQIAFAAISQDSAHMFGVFQGFLFGSGFGTFFSDFMRFKPALFNANQTLWTVPFGTSSNLVLDLLATTGVLGFATFIYILYTGVKEIARARAVHRNPLVQAVTASLIFTLLATVLIPFSIVTTVTFFIIIGLFAGALRSVETPATLQRYYDVIVHFTAYKEGSVMGFHMSPAAEAAPKRQTDAGMAKFFPVSLFLLFSVIVAVTGLYLYWFISSDMVFRHSYVAAAQNNGLQTYYDQRAAMQTFPYREGYFRIASQTDLALANLLASNLPKDSSPSAQVQQTITTLIQESIGNARTATQLSPLNTIDWQNLSSVYRAMIGYGKGADQFAVQFQQQAVQLAPNDPQSYINLGGIYYQLQAWDNAQQAFQVAIQLKPDYANAYYNLGHALESKSDLQNALLAYETVQQLTGPDKDAQKKIATEIDTLKKKIGEQAKAAQQKPTAQQTASSAQQPVELNKPANQLPEQQQPVKIPEPKVTVTPGAASSTPAATTPAPSK